MWGACVCEEAGSVSGILIGGSELVKYQHRESDSKQKDPHSYSLDVRVCVEVLSLSNKK